jgi:hypothetical protein
MKYLLTWISDRPEAALRERFNSQLEVEEYVKTFLPEATVLTTPRPNTVLGDICYVWKNAAALQSGKPHVATIAPVALGSTVQIDAAFARPANPESGK